MGGWEAGIVKVYEGLPCCQDSRHVTEDLAQCRSAHLARVRLRGEDRLGVMSRDRPGVPGIENSHTVRVWTSDEVKQIQSPSSAVVKP